MFNHDIDQRGGSFEQQQLAQIRLRIEMASSPASVEELIVVMREQGHDVELIAMKNAGIRQFGVIGHIRVDGFECVAKLAGEHLPEDHRSEEHTSELQSH